MLQNTMGEMDFENRIVAPEYTPGDGEVETSLRPKTRQALWPMKWG